VNGARKLTIYIARPHCTVMSSVRPNPFAVVAPPGRGYAILWFQRRKGDTRARVAHKNIAAI
jgi:hypothetical protein